MNKKKGCIFHIEKKYSLPSVYKYEFLFYSKLSKSHGGWAF
jgi:hypothetical protein